MSDNEPRKDVPIEAYSPDVQEYIKIWELEKENSWWKEDADIIDQGYEQLAVFYPINNCPADLYPELGQRLQSWMDMQDIVKKEIE